MYSPFSYTPSSSIATPTSVDEAIALLTDTANANRPILFLGGGTKWDAGHRAFAESANPLLVSTAKLTGILDYDPGELTITARAGTPIAEIEAALAQHGQYLPFDPLFSREGATVGGTVAAGLTGPRRMRYGGLRDFVIGIEYLNASGERVRSGGKVVKNAAGYDFSKLFCGSMGSLGLITQVSFKVFPAPQGQLTLVTALPKMTDVKAAFRALQHSPVEVSAVNAWPAGMLPNTPDQGAGYTFVVLIEGASASLDARWHTVLNLIKPAAAHTFNGAEEQAKLWSTLRELSWLGTAEAVLKLYLPSTRVGELDAILEQHEAYQRMYSVAGNIAWASLNGDPARLSSALAANEISAAVWRSPVPAPDVLPALSGAAMVQRVKRAFDPTARFYRGA